MKLNSKFSNDFLEVIITSSTVIEPEEKAYVHVHWTALQKCSIASVSFEIENAPIKILISDELLEHFPMTLAANDSFEWEFPIQSVKDQEGFGIIHSNTELKIESGDSQSLTTDTWLSVFKEMLADKEGLSYELRKRLIDVVNYRPRNGHIFLANYELFFNDFLNINVPESIAKFLSEEFELPNEGLPVDDEIRYEVIHGKFSFYGIEELEMLAEEDCNESDSRFDAEGVREVKNMEV
jgi:hypothetical protein